MPHPALSGIETSRSGRAVLDFRQCSRTCPFGSVIGVNWSWRRGRIVLVVAVWAFICGYAAYETRHNEHPWELIAALVATTVALASVRRLPLLSLATASASSLAILPNYVDRFPAWPIFLMLTAGYLAGRRMNRARPAALSFTGVATVALPISFALTEDGLGSWVSLLVTLLFAVFVPWHLGRYVRLREDLIRTGWERAERLEHEQQVAAEQARLRERARIATDMHDSLGHELSLIALRAGALEVSADLDERNQTAAGKLRQSAAVATDRLHEIIDVLRGETDPAPVHPAAEGIEELIERAAGSGMAVSYDVDPLDTASPMVQRAVHRVVQEGLTNAAKHAPGAAVRVSVRRGDDETVVTVANDPPPAGPLPGVASGGRGITGLEERVRLVGGTLRARPRDRGFEVVAHLPHDAPTVLAAPEPRTGLESESARQLATARRQLRLTLINAVALPVGVLVVVIAVSAIYLTVNTFNSELDPDAYDRMRVGQLRDELEPVLPGQQRLERPNVDEPPTRPGSVCEYYGTDADLLGTSGDVYRLCFDDGTLVSKDVLTKKSEEDAG